MIARKDEDDQDLLRRAFKDVKPLKGRAIRKAAPPSKPVRKLPAKRIAAPAVPQPISKPAPPALPELTPGTANGVDLRTVRKLKRGKMSVGARLDLHGHTQDQAFTALARFLETSQAMATRTVLVITGKSGVLRQQVPRWLNGPPNRARVLSFTAARPNDGGDGALYILLRKAKSS
jgi:DNA-nicking Smr family endonuclease